MPGIINARAWLSQRRHFLQDELAKDPTEEQRAVLEAELAAVDHELSGGRRRWWRGLLWGAGPPGQA